MVNDILSQILYGISGFLFGIFAVRNGRMCATKLTGLWHTHGFSLSTLWYALPYILIVFILGIVFPIWLYSRTPTGGFVYLATIVYFNMKINRQK